MIKNFCQTLLLPVFLLFTVSLLAQAPEFGQASYYSDRYQGRRTAYGDTYDKNKLTCSHKKHPYGTLLKITRIDNKKSVVCKVIDQGPYTNGRIVDLSRAAAQKLDMIPDGVVDVMVEVFRRNDAGDDITGTPSAPQRPEEYTTPQPNRSSQELQEAAKPTPPPAATTPQPVTAPKIEAKPAKAEAAPTNPLAQNYTKYGLYVIRLEQGKKAGYAVQVMVVSDYEGVMKTISSLQSQSFSDILVSVEPGQTPNQTLYKIMLGPFDSEQTAKTYQANLKRRYKINGFVVNLEEKDYPRP